MLLFILIGGAAVLGLALGRWWSLGLAIPIGVAGAQLEIFENTDPPSWDFGLVVGLIAAVAIAVGVLLRRTAAR